jgi:FkbM family methyltransferase
MNAMASTGHIMGNAACRRAVSMRFSMLLRRQLVKPRLWLRQILRRLGYDLHSLPVDSLTLRDLEFDLCNLVRSRNPVVFDVGANTGQSIDLFRRTLATPRIYSFEPNPALAAILKHMYADCGVMVEAMALGSSEGTTKFNVSENHELSSILDVDKNDENPFSDVPLSETISVPVTTIDSYVEKHGITHIELLKIDTQGFDLEVLRGASGILDRRGVDTLLVEVNFASYYKRQASFGEVERFLTANGYRLLTLYEVTRMNSCLKWATACFRHPIP